VNNHDTEGESMVSKQPNYGEVKYFKILFQNFSVVIEFETFKLYISVCSILNITQKQEIRS
jgi:hypothetical protein